LKKDAIVKVALKPCPICGAVAPGAFFRPLSFDEIAAYMAKRPMGAHPGFADFAAQSR
jgi:hypothetical protein